MIELAKQYVRELPVSMSLLGKHIINLSSGPQNPLAYSPSLSMGVQEIQRKTPGDTVATASPCHIYIPAGVHTLTAPITITRHNVTLTIDGGATIIAPTNQAAIIFDGTQTPEEFMKHWGLFLYGVIRTVSGSSGNTQHGVVLREAIHGALFANEICNVDGDGLRFDGSCFSNKIDFNRIHGANGWDINSVNDTGNVLPIKNSNLVTGEVQYCGLGAANFRRWRNSEIYLRVENMPDDVDHVTIDSCFNLRYGGYFETDNTTGDDIIIKATDELCEDLTFDHLVIPFEKDSGSFNIRVDDSSVDGLHFRQVRAKNISQRLLSVGTGNKNITQSSEARMRLSSITNSSPGQYHVEQKTLAQSGLSLANPTDTNENILATITVPAHSLGKNGLLEIDTQWVVSNDADVKTARVRWGGIGGTVVGQLTLTSNTGGRCTTYIQAENLTNAQRSYMIGGLDTTVIRVWGAAALTVDTTADVTIVITAQRGSGSGAFSLRSYSVKLLPGV